MLAGATSLASPGAARGSSKPAAASGSGLSSEASGSSTEVCAASGSSLINFDWCSQYSGNGSPILTTTDGVSNAIVWVLGAEGDNEIHGFNVMNGQVVFSGSGTAMSGLHHFQTILATRNRFYVAGYNKVYSFKFGK